MWLAALKFCVVAVETAVMLTVVPGFDLRSRTTGAALACCLAASALFAEEWAVELFGASAHLMPNPSTYVPLGVVATVAAICSAAMACVVVATDLSTNTLRLGSGRAVAGNILACGVAAALALRLVTWMGVWTSTFGG